MGGINVDPLDLESMAEEVVEVPETLPEIVENPQDNSTEVE